LEKERSIKNNLPVVVKNEHILHIDPKTFKIIKDKKIKFKPEEIKINS